MNDKFQSSGVTLRDIAKNLGISHVTVSLALRESSKISVERRKQIQEAAMQMGYRPNPMATALGQLRYSGKARAVTGELAWLTYQEDTKNVRRFKEFNLYWQGASQTATWFGYNLEEFSCNASLNLARLESILLARGIHGILIPPHSLLPADWNLFHWDRFSVVKFGHSIKNPRVHVVTSDQLSNSLLAFSRMQAKGYQRIGFITSVGATTRHLAGVLMAQASLVPKHRLSTLTLTTGESDNAVDQNLLEQWIHKQMPDAILTDVAGVREMLYRAGYAIPKDIGLAVFSVLDGNGDTGIYQNPEHIGKAAVEMLISLIAHNHTGIPKVCRELLIEGDWVDGTSLQDGTVVKPGRGTRLRLQKSNLPQ